MTTNSLKYKYALDKFGNVISISEAKKGNTYFFGKTDIELIVKDGGTNRKHFSLKSGGSINSLGVGGGGESPEHYNAKLEIKKQGFFYWDNLKIKPHRIEVEYYFKGIIKESDVVFFDENDNIMCIIEVYFTNKKTEKDIKKFNELNIPVYEYNINNGETELLCWSVSSENDRIAEEKKLELWYEETIRTKLGSTEQSTIRTRKEIGRVREDIRKQTLKLEEIEGRRGTIKDEKGRIEIDIRKSSERSRKIREESDSITKGISRDRERESDLRGKIEWTEKEIKDTEKQSEESESVKIRFRNVESEIEEVRRKITTVRGNISWQNNRSQQARTILKRGY